MNSQSIHGPMEAANKETALSEQKKTGLTEEEMTAQKKANSVAKRKRAKARKQAQKAEERSELEQKKKSEALAAKKAASAVLCAACRQGIIDCGFEKFGKSFCSPKCARTAAPTGAL
jgi:hypothetical protein